VIAIRKTDEEFRMDNGKLRRQLREEAELLAIPIDFDQLVKDGILKKRGAWWELLDIGRLPEHARCNIKAFKSIKAGNALQAGNCVQFWKHDPRLKDRFK
jgi:hypothetical protein